MKKKSNQATFDIVRELAGELPETEESTSYGTPAFKRKGKLFLRLWEDNETLVVRTEIDQRESMITEEPDVYFLTDHYLNYPWILVRLSQIRKDALKDLIVQAWTLTGKTKPKKK